MSDTITTFAEAVDAAWNRRPASLVVGDLELARQLRAALDDRVGAGADLIVVVCGDEELRASPCQRRAAPPATPRQLALLRRLRGARRGDETLTAGEASAELDELLGQEDDR
jgi:hypothetical protein